MQAARLASPSSSTVRGAPAAADAQAGAAPPPGVQARLDNPALLPPQAAPEENHEEDDGGDDGDEQVDRTCASLAQMLAGVDMRKPERAQEAFRELARRRDSLAPALHHPNRLPALSGLAYQLHRFLEELQRHIGSGVIDLKAEGAEAAAVVCAGLGLVSDMADAGIFTERTLKSLRVIACQLTGLLKDVIVAGMHRDAESANRLLALSTWCSRGLKAHLLQSDDKRLRDVFRLLLDAMQEWATPPEHGDKSGPLALNAHRLGICFVQINTIRQFQLLHLASEGTKAKAHRAELQAVLKSLCGLLPQLPGNNGVQIANVCNTLKDFLDAGLLPEAAHGWLMPAIAVLLQRMPGVPGNELLHRGGQVLANFGNFLRMMFELGLHRKAGFTGCAAGYRDACAWLCRMLAAPGFALAGHVGQSLANLMSFVKAMARMEEQLRPSGTNGTEEAAHRQDRLNRATRSLLALLAREDLSRLSPMSISGLLSALAYLRARGMAPAERCGSLTRGLLEAIPAKAQRHWDAATVALSLRAIVQLQPLQPAPAEPMKAAYLLLLALAGRHRIDEASHRLYCLQALRLGLQQAWSDIDDAAMQAALRSLLRWQGARGPSLADLEAAIGALAHTEEPAPAPLEDLHAVPEAETLAPQPGTPEWVPPGGKLAGVSSAPSLGHGASTWRASASTVPAASATTTLTATTTTTSASTSVTAAARNASRASTRPPGAAREPDAETRWFELASSERHDDAQVQRMIALAREHPRLVSARDGGNYGAMYYAILTGKLALVQWLLQQPGYALGMALPEFREAVEEGMLHAPDPGTAERAYRHFLKAASRFEESHAEEDRDMVPADPSTTTSDVGGKRQPPASAALARRKATTQTQAAKSLAQQSKPHGDPEQRRQEWLRLARNPNSGKAALQRMKALAEIDPDIIDCRDESGLTALGHAIARKDRRRVAWLQPLYGELIARGILPLVDVMSEMETRAKAIVASQAPMNAPTADKHPDGKDEQAQLDDAFRQDDAPRLSRLLRTRSGRKWAEECDSGGHNKLMLAAHMGRQRIVEALLDWDDGSLGAKASVYGYTAFLIAAGAGNLNIVKAMLKSSRGKLASQRTPDGMNALMVAANRGKLDCVKYLLAWNGGALVKQVTNKGENALIIAARGGWKEVVRTLLTHDDAWLAGTIADNGETAMTAAAECGHAEVVRLLRGSRYQLELLPREDCTPLLLAARGGHVEVLRVLLESQPDDVLVRFAMPYGRDALMLAAENGHLEAVKLLAGFGSGWLLKRSLPGKGTTSLMLAARNHHAGVVETLLDLGGEELARREDENGDTAFVAAAIGNAVDVLRCLLRRRPALAAQMLSTGQTAFKRAVAMAYFHGSPEALEFLREQAGTLGWQWSPAGPSPAAPRGRDDAYDAH